MDEKVVKDLIDRLIDLSFAETSVMVTILHCRVFRQTPWENQNF